MNQVFLKMLNNSFTAGWMILAVILLRVLLKKAPKWTACLLWGFVAIRLVFPFHIESVLCLIPSANTVPDKIVYSAVPNAATGIQAADNIVNPAPVKHLKPDPVTTNTAPLQIWITACCVIWIIGVAAMLIYTLASFLLLKRKVSVSLMIFGNVYACDNVNTPFILGILRPRIYLPSGMDAVTTECVLAHEQTHIQRLDYIWKPLGFLILSVYWFHPLCWAAYILSCRDIEYACDEKATRNMDKTHRADYCQALLTCSTKKKRITACPVAFGEAGVKGRIRSVLHYKKPAFWMIAASLAVCALTAACFLTNPKTEGQAKDSLAGAEKQARDGQTDTKGSAGASKAISKNEEKNRPENAAPNAKTRKTEEENLSVISSVINMQKLDYIVEHAASVSREGYQEASVSYVDNAEVGWDYFFENPWGTDGQRDRLAQAALQELYTLTGCQLSECVYTTDGRSKFIFGKSANAIKRSTAFYVRDYGWTLTGDHTPYMGFVNARRVWYSDVQQLDSPWHDPDYQGHGAIPAWFLDHSGVYQGHKIKGYDVFNLDDNVFTHVRLNFDGGYYIVVMDESIESAADVSGPYYETDEEITKIVNEFAEAYFSGDARSIRKFLADSYEGDMEVYLGDGRITDILIKGLPGRGGQDIDGKTCEVSLEYRDSELENTFRYLTISFIRQKDSWKIQFYGLEG